MGYNIAEYVIGWHFNGEHDGDKMAHLFQTIFVRFTNEAFKRTNTHTRTHSDELNGRECNHIINPISNNFIM